MERLTAISENGKAYYPYCFREDTCDGCGSSEKCHQCELSLKVCETLAAYENTGLTPEQIMELKERDTAKSPREICDEYSYFVCPSCGEGIYASDDFESHKFCLNCGQRLKWEE